MSPSLRPKFILASIKPNLLPQSKRFPSNSIPYNPGVSTSLTRLSVNCISFPYPFFWRAKKLKIFEFNKYLPTTVKLDGATLSFGFSTKLEIEK